MPLYLQRHTKPPVKSCLCYGFTDLNLDTKYTNEHLPAVIKRLDDLNFKHIYSSPLNRCSLLALDLAQHLNHKEIIYDTRLKELNFGDWEMMNWDDIYKLEEGKIWFQDYLNYKIPGGESLNELLFRAQDFLSEIDYKKDNILAVTHSGFIRAALIATDLIKREDAFSLRIDYGELVIIP